MSSTPDPEPIELQMSEATGLSVGALRSLQQRFKTEGMSADEFKKFIIWKAGQLGNTVEFL